MTPVTSEDFDVVGPRTRSRDRNSASPGIYLYNGVQQGSGPTGVQAVNDFETCSDTTMAPPFVVDHPLVINHKRFVPLRINGSGVGNPPFSGTYTFQGYNPVSRTYYAYLANTPAVDWSYWKTAALANINPYRPKVDLPLFLFEFKDFPSMLRHAGRVLKGSGRASDVPGTWLAYSFGWAPLVSDLLALFDMSQSIEDRCRMLRNLEDGHLFKRTLFDGEVSDSTQLNALSYTPQMQGNIPAYRADLRTVLHRKVWFTANAKLRSALPNDGAAIRTLSKRMVYGLTWRPWSVWEFLPWSWLIDYFANVGDFLEAQGALVHLNVTRMNLMCEQDLRSIPVNVRLATGLSASGGAGITISKQRSVVSNPTPRLAFQPFLSELQVANLAALVTSRAFDLAR